MSARGCHEDAHEYPPEVAWTKRSFKKKTIAIGSPANQGWTQEAGRSH